MSSQTGPELELAYDPQSRPRPAPSRSSDFAPQHLRRSAAPQPSKGPVQIGQMFKMGALAALALAVLIGVYKTSQRHQETAETAELAEDLDFRLPRFLPELKKRGAITRDNIVETALSLAAQSGHDIDEDDIRPFVERLEVESRTSQYRQKLPSNPHVQRYRDVSETKCVLKEVPQAFDYLTPADQEAFNVAMDQCNLSGWIIGFELQTSASFQDFSHPESTWAWHVYELE